MGVYKLLKRNFEELSGKSSTPQENKAVALKAHIMASYSVVSIRNITFSV
jgi:hypothetical protein